MLTTSHYDKGKADYAIAFIENLRHTKGEWHNKPFKLLDWQIEIIRNIFGVVKNDGNRQFNTGYVEIAKKQASRTWGGDRSFYASGG